MLDACRALIRKEAEGEVFPSLILHPTHFVKPALAIESDDPVMPQFATKSREESCKIIRFCILRYRLMLVFNDYYFIFYLTLKENINE